MCTSQPILTREQITFYLLKKTIFLYIFSVFCLFPQTYAQIIYVDSSVTVSGDGSSWANAYKELSDAIVAINTDMSVTQLNIAKGTYSVPVGSNPDTAFCIYRDNIRIYGGYPNGGGSRDVNANVVNLSGTYNNPNAAVHVMVIAGITTGADNIVLDGLTFSNGYATSGAYSYFYNGQEIYKNIGSGLCLRNNRSDINIMVTNCVFTNNTANTGAGIYSYSTGTLVVDSSSFVSNIGYGSLMASVLSFGAGLYNNQTTAHVTNCSFKGNTFNRSGDGIGLYNENASITILNTSFVNQGGGGAPENGGAIANESGASADIGYCTFTDNYAEDDGSAIYNSASVINLHNSTVTANTSMFGGTVVLSASPGAVINGVSFVQNSNGDKGGVVNINCSPVISNCLFSQNAAYFGGAMYNQMGAVPFVSNCTFYNNTGYFAGGGIYCADGSGGSYRNCIFWGDTTLFEIYPHDRDEIFSENDGSNPSMPPPAVSYSLIKTPFPIMNVIDSGSNGYVYPMFVDATNIAGPDNIYGTGDDGLRLQRCSPGIDAGIDSAIPAGITKDLKNDDRIINGAVDIGAYENTSPVDGSTLIANGGDSVFRSVYGATYLLSDCRLIAGIVPSGASPVAGEVKAKVTIDNGGALFTIPYVQRYYDIIPSLNATTATATVSLYFTQADFDAYNLVRGALPLLPVDPTDAADNKSNVTVHQFHETSGNGTEAIIIPSGVVWDTLNNWWVVSFDVTGFSSFFLNSSLATLPVMLEYFRGQSHESYNYLSWKADCSNAPTSIMELQRSGDGDTFTTLYNTTTDSQRCLEPFSYNDRDPLPGENYYRLEMKEVTGKITYSNTLLFKNTPKGNIIVNPTVIKTGQFLNVIVPQKNYVIAIYNSIGMLVKKQELRPGANSVTLTTTSGIYFYNISGTNQQIRKTGKIIIE